MSLAIGLMLIGYRRALADLVVYRGPDGPLKQLFDYAEVSCDRPHGAVSGFVMLGSLAVLFGAYMIWGSLAYGGV